MKICMIGSLPPPYGGVSTHCYYLSEELAKDGIQIHFLDTAAGEKKQIPARVFYDQFQRMNFFLLPFILLIKPGYLHFLFQLVRILGISRIRNIEYALSIIRFLSMLHKENNLDLIHSHHAGIRSLAALLFSKYHRIPFVMTVHGAEITLDENWQREKRMISHLLQQTKHVISVSQFTASYLTQRGFQGNPYIIPNGIDVEKFRVPRVDLIKLKQKYHIPEKRQLLLYVSSFKKWKGPDIFIHALKKLKDPFYAIMIGRDLGYLQYCQELASEFQLSGKIKFLTNLPEEEVIGFYHLANIFIFPTKVPSEGFGIVAIEAMAAGTPVIASKIAAIPEIVRDGETGLLFEPGNPDELASKIELLLSDVELYERLRKNGFRLIKSSFTWSKISKKVARLYHEIVTA